MYCLGLQYDEIYLTFTTGSLFLCGICSPVVVVGLSVRSSWYPMLWMRLLRGLCMLRECEGDRVTAMVVWSLGEVWLWLVPIWVVNMVQVFCLG